MKFVGNKTSKMAHAQGCGLIKKIKAGNRENFVSKAAAKKARYKMHKACTKAKKKK